MTVQSAASRNAYLASGGATFPYSFLCLDADDLAVYDNGNLVQTSSYSVTNVGAAGGGNVVFGTPPTSGHVIIIVSNASYTQGLDLVENDPLPADSVEDALDRMTILAKQLKEITDRAPKFDIQSCDSNLAINTVVGQAGKVASIASSENRIEWVSVSQAQAAATGTYTATGTGAVSRTVSSKLGEWVSVLDFGASDDGATDAATAFQQAIDAAQASGGRLAVFIPAASVRYLITTALTYSVDAPLTIFGAGKFATCVRYSGTGTWLAPTGADKPTRLLLADFTLDLTGTGGVGVNLSRANSSTVRSVRLVSGTGATNGVGIVADPSNAGWTPTNNVLEDVTFDGLSAGVVLETQTANGPHAWRIVAPTFLNGCGGILVGNSSTQPVSGTAIVAPRFSEQTGNGITLGANAAYTTVVAPVQTNAAGGTLFAVNASATRTKVLGTQVLSGAAGTTTLGMRAFEVGDWSEGIQWSGDTCTTMVGLSRSSNGAIQQGCTNFTVAPAVPNGSGTPDARTVYGQSLAAAWVVFDGTNASPITPALSFNIKDARVIKQATGQYCVSFLTAFSCNRYIVSGICSDDNVGQLFGIMPYEMNAGCCNFRLRNQAGTLTDKSLITVTFHGTQA